MSTFALAVLAALAAAGPGSPNPYEAFACGAEAGLRAGREDALPIDLDALAERRADRGPRGDPGVRGVRGLEGVRRLEEAEGQEGEVRRGVGAARRVIAPATSTVHGTCPVV